MKLWGGRFQKNMNAAVEAYTASITVDQLLAKYDLQGSIAHAAMLTHCQLLTPAEGAAIIQGLQSIWHNLASLQAQFSSTHEDIHMNIEVLLRQHIGELAGKLHMGRSRNDQVALDTHLYLREKIVLTVKLIVDLQAVLLVQAAQHIETLLPGYTHLQRAEPIRLAHYLLAYVAKLQRDAQRFINSLTHVNVSPLGAAALAGSGLALQPQHVADLLQMSATYTNSLDAVSDRDYVIEYVANSALLALHLSQMSEEFIMWSSQEFQFIEFDDAFCTGSSMMPQKKNPDIAELIRGKSARVIGQLTTLLVLLKGLPLAYNRDLQEDKSPLFDTVHTVTSSLQVLAPMLATAQFNTATMAVALQRDFASATQVANYLVQRGVVFRKAHEITGNVVAYCVGQKKYFADLTLQEFQQFSPLFGEDIAHFILAESVVEAHQVPCGTAKAAVLKQLQAAQLAQQTLQGWVSKHQQQLSEVDNHLFNVLTVTGEHQ